MLKKTPKKRVLFVRRFTPALLALFGVFCFVSLNLRMTSVANAVAVNNTINFQARLQTAAGGIVPDNTYNIEFKLYTTSSGGTAVWTEEYLNNASHGLSTVNGYFSTSLGSLTSFPTNINWNQQLWLTMNIGGSGASASWDGEMDPRLQLTAVPYAFQANQLAQSNSDATLNSTLSIQAPTNGNQSFVIQDQGAAGTYNLLTTNQANANYIQLQSSTPGTAQTGNINITGTAKVGDLQVASGGNVLLGNGALTLGGSTTATYTTPASQSLSTKIAIPSFNPGANGQIIAFGLPSNADVDSRALTVIDARSSAHQPSIALLSPNESKVFGLSWDGSNSTAVIKTSSNTVALQANGQNVLTGSNVSGSSVITIGTGSGSNGKLQIANSANANTVTVQATGTSGSYTIELPSAIGTTGDCLAVGSVSGSIETLTHQSCSGGGGGGSSGTLQDAYTNSGSSANVLLNSTAKGITIQDASTTVGGNLFAVQNNATTTNYLAVSTTGTSVAGSLTVAGVGLLKSDSTTALRVQTADGSATAFDVDTTNSRIGVGTDTPTRTVDVAVDSATTNSLPLLLRQSGTGDVGLELQAAGQNFYQGIDASDGQFKISSKASANGTFTVGYAGNGNSVDGYGRQEHAYRVQTGSNGGTVTSIAVNIYHVAAPTEDHIQLFIYSDNGSGTAPDTLVGSTQSVVPTTGWNTLPITGVTLSASTYYWIGFVADGSTLVYDQTGGGTNVYSQLITYGTLDNTWSPMGGSNGEYAVYMNVQQTGATDDFGNINLFSLGATGDAVFTGVANSATAFRVQNATGTSLFTVNTTDDRVVIGPVDGDSSGTILVLGKKTDSGDPAEVDGAMYYNASAHSFRCGVAGIWVSCIGGLLSASTGSNSGGTVANTTSETAFTTTYHVPANYCANGRTIRLTAYGVYQSANGADLTIHVKLGTTTLSSTVSYATLGTHGTDTPWMLNFMAICPNAAGSNATVTGQGLLTVGGETSMPLPFTSTSTTDTSTSQTLSMTAEWGAASTSNIVTLDSFVLEGLGP
jgi:hypothetical protein